MVYISTIIIFILFVGVIIYHLFLLIRKDKPPDEHEVDEFLQALVHPAKAETSFFFPDHSDQSPGSQVNFCNVDKAEVQN